MRIKTENKSIQLQTQNIRNYKIKPFTQTKRINNTTYFFHFNTTKHNKSTTNLAQNSHSEIAKTKMF